MVNALTRYRLNVLGIYPRHMIGLIGIPCSSFLHGSFSHLMFNVFPLFILSNLILLQVSESTYIHVSLFIIAVSGALLWLFGRRAIHVGASALIMGYFGFIVIGVYHQPNVIGIIAAIVCVYYLGGMFSNLLPSKDKTVSWEGHLFGFLSGILAAWVI